MAQERVSLDEVEELPDRAPARLLSGAHGGTLTHRAIRQIDPPVILAPDGGDHQRGVPRALPGVCPGRALRAGRDRPDPDPVPHGSGCHGQVAAGLYVCEMVTTRALLIRNEKTMRMVEFGPDEHPRSLQLYGVDPAVVADAVHMVVDENLADHIDLNFGCPVPKVTRRGGGSALPWRRRFSRRSCAPPWTRPAPAGIPVTVKMRKGIDDDHLTYRYAGLLPRTPGSPPSRCTPAPPLQGYSGNGRLGAIADLKQSLDIPVLGNGDIWEAADALRMVAQTGADGVVVGRGAWVGRGCSTTSPRRSRAPRAGYAHPRRGGRHHAPPRDWAGRLGTRSSRTVPGTARARLGGRSTTPAPTSASTSPGTSRVSRSGETCAAALRWCPPWPSSTNCSPSWITKSRFPSGSSVRPVGGPALLPSDLAGGLVGRSRQRGGPVRH